MIAYPARVLRVLPICLVVAASGALGCAGLDEGSQLVGDCQQSSAWADSKDDFSDLYSEISSEFGGSQKAPLFDSTKCALDDPKADGFGFLPEPCDLLAALVPFGDDALRSGFVLGIEGNGVLGPGIAFGGYDMVWDLYHQQLTVSQYGGAGVSTPGVGASVTAYAGIALGFETNVTQWHGNFVTLGTELSLPLLTDFVSLNPSIYATAIDEDKDGYIVPSEVLAPPEGIYGFTVGIEFGADLLPTFLPVSASVKEGLWTPYRSAIRELYDELRTTRMFFTTLMKVRLLNSASGELCPNNWPKEHGDLNCLIEFGDPSDSFVQRSIYTAYSICYLTGRCAVPLSWPLSASAVAIAALRDLDLRFEDYCPDQAAAMN